MIEVKNQLKKKKKSFLGYVYNGTCASMNIFVFSFHVMQLLSEKKCINSCEHQNNQIVYMYYEFNLCDNLYYSAHLSYEDQEIYKSELFYNFLDWAHGSKN